MNITKKVLIADDIEFVRKTLTEILTQAHYQVVGEATNGHETIDLYNKLRPDIVTMDIVMPLMSGLDATRKILNMDKKANIIIISAMGQENLVMEAIDIGAKDYILKPFHSSEVVLTLNRVLSNQLSLPKVNQKIQPKTGGSLL